jgi:hypothetical protein
LIVEFDGKGFRLNDPLQCCLFLLFCQFVDEARDLNRILDENCFFLSVVQNQVDLRDVATRVSGVAFPGDRHFNSLKIIKKYSLF